MSIPLTAEIRKPSPKPNDADEFEIQCCKLFALHFNHPNMSRNGRKNQQGCDVIGYKDGDFDYPVGIQCKAKPKVTEAEICQDFHDAMSYRPRLKEWVVATTAPSSPKWKQLAATLTLASSPNPAERFEVRILSWDEMETLILDNPASLDYFDPFFSPFLNNFKADLAAGFDKILANSERRLSAQNPLPFVNGEPLFYQIFPERSKPEKLPAVFESEAYFYAHVFPASRPVVVQLSTIETVIGASYIELPPSAESDPVRNIGDYSLFANSRFSTRADKRVLLDGVGLYRHGEAFVFDKIDKSVDVERLGQSLNKVMAAHSVIWQVPVHLSVGVKVRQGDRLSFKVGNKEIAHVTPAQNLTSRRLEIGNEGGFSPRLFIDLIESGGANAEQGTQALGKLLNGLKDLAEERERNEPVISDFADIEF